jgi:hypothetical protein
VAQLLTPDERKRCTIVFDAIDAPADLPDRFQFAEMRIWFAERGHEADELIETLIRQHSAPRQLAVISSDHRLQKAIRRRRGFAMDSEAFLKQRESPGKPAGPVRSLKPAAQASEKELEFWLKEFEGVHPSSLIVDSASESSTPKSRWDREIEDLQNRLKDQKQLDDWLNESDKNDQ